MKNFSLLALAIVLFVSFLSELTFFNKVICKVKEKNLIESKITNGDRYNMSREVMQDYLFLANVSPRKKETFDIDNNA